MKILHVIQGLEESQGGPSESIPMTAMAQKFSGLDVGIATCDYSGLSLKAQEAAGSGVRMHIFKASSSKTNPIGFSIDFMRRFESVATDYDIIHTHAQWLFTVWWSAHVARKLGKKLILMPRGSFESARLKKSAWKKKIVGWIDKYYANKADAVWATAPSEEEGIKAFAKNSHVEVFPIGLDVRRYPLSKQGGKTLLYFSRITPIKGLDILADAWARVNHNGWKLLIVGPDDRGYTEEIMKVFEDKCAKDFFEFRGPAYGNEKLKILSSADAFVLPTRNENWGIAVAEAMASGLPVICTKGAPWGCLEKVHAGWWPDINADSIANALVGLIAMSPEERKAMGANGRRWAEENLDWGKIGTDMKKSYERLFTANF